MSAPVPSPPPDASATRRGLVNTIAQTWAGRKTAQDGLTLGASLIFQDATSQTSAGITAAAAASTYLTQAAGLTAAAAASTYLTQANAASTYLTQAAGLTAATAAATYLTLAAGLTAATAAATYQTIALAETATHAAATYQTIALAETATHAAATYQTIALAETATHAAATYLALAGGTLTGGLNGTTATFTGAVKGDSFGINGAVGTNQGLMASGVNTAVRSGTGGTVYLQEFGGGSTYLAASAAGVVSTGPFSSSVASGSAALAMTTGQKIFFNASGSSFIDEKTIQFRTGTLGVGCVFTIGTAADGHIQFDTTNAFSLFNPIVNNTIHCGYFRCATTHSNNTIRFGNGRSPSGVLGSDTFTSTSGYIPHLLHRASVQPASGSLKFAGWELNPTLNGVSSSVAAMLAIAPVVTAWTGGTVKLIDAGTTTTDYNTGFTSKFAVDTNGKITVPSAAGAPTAGTATLVGGTVTISTTALTANSRVLYARNTNGGTVGHLSAPTASRTAGTSFVINSSSGSETSTVDWWIIDAA